MSKFFNLSQFSAAAVAAIAVAGALLVTSQPVQARERQASVSGPKGQMATRHVQRAQGDVSSSTVGPRGSTASRAVDRSAEGAVATVTGPNGQTRTRNTEYQGGGDSSTTVTRANGQTATREVTRQP
jgi:hypothetical protein